MSPDAALIAALPITTVTGQWQRHVPTSRVARALQAIPADGRWGSRTGFPVLYLGQPRDSVVVEAYRRLIDPVEEPDRESLLAQLAPRTLVTCDIDVTNILDLRTPGARASAGLTITELQSATDDMAAYEQCRAVANVAHQLGRHGLISPAATGLGFTLALFTDVLPEAQRPRILEDQQESWPTLPPDPRNHPQGTRLRAVD
ncbi:MAG: RES family NAD+ phosphorylase [Micrococcales bacterium]|nr:RES family NAD+ phosphorylase [Micrococcales bacterium]